MFEELMNLVQQHGQESVVNNPDVPNEHNDGVMQEASSSLMAGLQQMMQTNPGQVQEMAQAVQAGDTNHPAVQQLSGNFAGNIMQKFGLNSGVAQTIAASLIPMVLSKVMNNSSVQSNGGGGFNMGGLLGSLMGGGNSQPGATGGGDMMNTLSSLGTQFGLDKNGDGKTDLGDLMGMLGK